MNSLPEYWAVLCTEDDPKRGTGLYQVLDYLNKKYHITYEGTEDYYYGEFPNYRGVVSHNFFPKASIDKYLGTVKLLSVEEFLDLTNSGTGVLEERQDWYCDITGINEKSFQILKEYMGLLGHQYEHMLYSWVLDGYRYLYIYKDGRVSMSTQPTDEVYPHDRWVHIRYVDLMNRAIEKINKNNKPEETPQNNHNGHESNEQDGTTVKVQRIIGTISTGERPTGTAISGRKSKATIGFGHLSNQSVSVTGTANSFGFEEDDELPF